MSQKLLQQLQAQFPKQVLRTQSYRGDETAVIDKRAIRGVCKWLLDNEAADMNMLTDLTVVDYLGRSPRFEVVYHFYSMKLGHRIRLKACVSEDDTTIDSICDLWKVANWLEREAWDLYGVKFNNHPDMRRILMYEEFQGHPLRKDYPKRKRQPRVRRPQDEIAKAMERRPRSGKNLAAPSENQSAEGSSAT